MANQSDCQYTLRNAWRPLKDLFFLSFGINHERRHLWMLLKLLRTTLSIYSIGTDLHWHNECWVHWKLTDKLQRLEWWPLMWLTLLYWIKVVLIVKEPPFTVYSHKCWQQCDKLPQRWWLGYEIKQWFVIRHWRELDVPHAKWGSSNFPVSSVIKGEWILC